MPNDDFKNLSVQNVGVASAFLPGRDTALAAHLHFDPQNGPELQLTDVNSNIGLTFIESRSTYPLIHGTLWSGIPFSLINSTTRQSRGGLSTVSERWIKAQVLLLGGHTPDPSTAAYNRITLEFTSLPDWINKPSVKFWTERVSDDPKLLKFTASAEQGIPFAFSTLHDKFTIKSGNSILTNGTGGRFGITIESDHHIQIETQDPKNLDEMTKIAFQTQGLLSLLCGRQVFTRAIRLLRSDLSHDDRLRSPVRYAAAFAQSKRQSKSDPEVLIPATLIKQSLPEIFANWYSNYDRYKSPIELFMATEMYPDHVISFEFLSVAQAAETLHRNFYDGKYMDEEHYRSVASTLSESIPDTITSDHRASLKSRIRYGNEYSLRKRLKDLAKSLPESSSELIHADINRFLDRCVDTRNYFTHYDEELQQAALDGAELYGSIRLLRWLCRATFLHLLGIDSQILTSAMSENRDLSHWRQLLDYSKGSG